MTVERLDFSKPPPGYNLDIIDDEWWWGDEPEWLAGTSYLDRDAALAAAWAHHKTRHDPPGMRVMGCVEAGAYTIDLDDGTHLAGHWYTSPEQARAAAWAWYEDAIEVADLLDTAPARIFDHRGKPVPHYWPNTLTWSDDQRAEVRSWLAWHTDAGQRDSRPPTLPEALRG